MGGQDRQDLKKTLGTPGDRGKVVEARGKTVQSVGAPGDGGAGSGVRVGGCTDARVQMRTGGCTDAASPGAAASKPRSPTVCPDAGDASCLLARCLPPPHGRLLPSPAAHAPPTFGPARPSLLRAHTGRTLSLPRRFSVSPLVSAALVPRRSLPGSLDFILCLPALSA